MTVNTVCHEITKEVGELTLTGEPLAQAFTLFNPKVVEIISDRPDGNYIVSVGFDNQGNTNSVECYSEDYLDNCFFGVVTYQDGFIYATGINFDLHLALIKARKLGIVPDDGTFILKVWTNGTDFFFTQIERVLV